MKLHHIGYLVNDIQKALNIFVNMGFEESSKLIIDNRRGIYILFLKNDNVIFELISPMDSQSVVGNLLKKIGSSPYHTAYLTSDIEQSITEMNKKGFKVIIEPQEAIAFDNKLVCFMYHTSIGMVELIETN